VVEKNKLKILSLTSISYVTYPDPDYEKQLKKSRQVNRSEDFCKIISFLENQRGIRTMYIGASDQNSIQKEKNKKQITMTINRSTANAKSSRQVCAFD
jgi:hypothetical protein